jgi:hypothetical protein
VQNLATFVLVTAIAVIATTAMVSNLAFAGMPGFNFKNRGDCTSTFVQNDVPGSEAAEYCKEIPPPGQSK